MTEGKMKNSWTADRIFVLASFFLLVLSFQFTKHAEYDFWWHLALGESVYSSGEIYEVDEFSYTFSGTPQFSSEWLSDLIIFLTFKAGGLLGANILKAVVILLTFYFLFLTIRNYTGDNASAFFATVISLTVVLFSIRFRLFVRPYIFSYLFIAIYLYILSGFEKNRRYKLLFVLPAIQILWSNMYSAAAFGPMLFVFFMIGRIVKKESTNDIPRLIGMFLLIIVASLISPEIHKPYLLLFKVATDPTTILFGEFQPLSTHLLWGYGLKYTFAYQILVLGSLLYFIAFKGWKSIYHVLLFAVFLAESVLHVRMIDVFSIVSVVFFCIPLERLLRRHAVQISPKKIMAPVMSAVILALIPISVLGNQTYPFGNEIKEDTFPEGSLEFLDKEKITGTMFNSHPFGGYIIWYSPKRKVFIDGRYSRLYTAEFQEGYHNILKSAVAWKSADEKWDFDYALLEYDMRSRLYPLHLNDNPDWALVYWDNISTIYLKRTEPNLKIIEKYEYKFTRPAFYDFGYIEMLTHSQEPDLNLLRQIDREIALNPSNQEPRIAKVFVLHSMGPEYFDRALRELERTKELRPDLAMEYSAAAFLLYKIGENDKASAETAKALSIDPGDLMGNQMKRFLNMD
jgi:hypothetical protein